MLRRTSELPPEKVKSIVAAICVLHNFLLTRNSRRVYAPNGIFDIENVDGTTVPGAWRNLEHGGMNDLEPTVMRNSPLLAKQVREQFAEYFMSPEGEVPWQYQYV